MIALYLLAAHLVGDYALQTRWQAAGKFGWTRRAIALRSRHVLAYTACFVPLTYDVLWWRAYAFLAGVAALHWLTDSRRFTSTLGDALAWRWCMSWLDRRREWLARGEHSRSVLEYNALPPSPWTPLPILLDQTLHAVQLAVLGGLLLT